MNIYLIKASNWGMDEYDAILVLARTSEEAKQFTGSYFSLDQTIRCSLVGVSNRKTKGILITSFNAA